MKLSAVLQPLARSALGIALRNRFGYRPMPYAPDLAESVSDLFLWRCDAHWETAFDLFHIAAVIDPAYSEPYTALINLYDVQGRLLRSIERRVAYGVLDRLDLSELLDCRTGIGSFAVFHLVDTKRLFRNYPTCLAERGYVSYRHRGDAVDVRSYVHGNQYAVGCRPDDRRIRVIGLRLGRRFAYQSQVTFDDCVHFELALTNPTSSPLEFKLELLDAAGTTVESIDYRLQVRGAYSWTSTQSGERPFRVRLLSRARMLRPLLFKHYASHFDVFHG